MERSISGDIGDGFVSINALAANPDKQDSFNCNIVIADEAHTYKSPKQYQILKDATKAYTNKLGRRGCAGLFSQARGILQEDPQRHDP